MSTKPSKSTEVVIVPEDGCPPQEQPHNREDGIEIPIDRLAPDTLRNLIGEFVSREWEELGDSGRYSLDDKIEQVLQQLKTRKARLVFDQTSKTCNIIPS